jgi:uncharacterized repeat protein (TIGR01451 family)
MAYFFSLPSVSRLLVTMRDRRNACRVFSLVIPLLCSMAYMHPVWGVPVEINSGNPAFPFPQFLPYAHASDTLQNLGTRNPVGVVHAEMEKSIREAYQIMMNRAMYPGGGVGGIKYVLFQSSPSCSEGTGYAMLAAAMMADKTTFDGLWLYAHDFAMNKVVRYSDGKSSPAYIYSALPGWTNISGGNSAADGDFDMALALLIAYKNWGDLMGINDSRGIPISYKRDCIEFLKGLTDSLPFVNTGGINVITGDIGLDGYFKGGDTWVELTGWASDIGRSHFLKPPNFAGPAPQHIDYTAPGYFNEFAAFLTNENQPAYTWNISQFKRAEASSDWLIGKFYQQSEKTIPHAGWVALTNDTTPVFSEFDAGEDFRCAWRTIINHLWHGASPTKWDPVNHSVVQGANTYEKDMALRYGRFLWDNHQAPWNNPCVTGVSGDYWGPEVLKWRYSHEGVPLGSFYLNWIHGVGAPAAVSSQNFPLMAAMYRYCEIEWDVELPGDRYLTSKPAYYHGFFRLLGMCIFTGNHQAPSQMKAAANMKVYLDVNRTYAFENDTIAYTIDYRNFGSIDGQNVVIKDALNRDFVFVSCTGGGVYNAGSHTVQWTIGTVPGFKTATGIAPTKGSVQLRVVIPKATQKRYQNRVEISCSNGAGWVSNDYANRVSPVVKMNGVDIASRALVIGKSVSRSPVNPGMTVTVSTTFENSAKSGWINGGRPGVRFAYAHEGTPAVGPVHRMIVKLFSDAEEPYIDYGNYRVSYYLYDAGRSGLDGSPGVTNGWHIAPVVVEGLELDKIRMLHEAIPAGQDSRGKWNQRLVVQFSDPTDPQRPDTNWATMATITRHLENYYGLINRVHRGCAVPLRLVWDINATGYANVTWSDDWSFNPGAAGTMSGNGIAVSPEFTDPNPDNPGVAVTTLNPKFCSTTTAVVDNILIEEWDGYTWRRVFGNGPLPGRDVDNVTVRDTIPAGLTFKAMSPESPLGIAPVRNGNVLTWTIPKFMVGQKGVLTYTVTVDPPLSQKNTTIKTRSWISSPKESPVSAEAVLLVTLDPLPPQPPTPTSMHKNADKKGYRSKDTIAYTISYRQTQGSMVTTAPAGEWRTTQGTGKLSIDNAGAISYDVRDIQMVHKYSYGTNGTLGGTITPASYMVFGLVMRQNQGNYVEIRFKQEAADLKVQFFNTKVQVGVDNRATYAGFPASFNYKIKLDRDTLRLWIGDTAAVLPSLIQTGVDVRIGWAGVMSGNDLGAKVSGWKSHLDAAFNVSIRDTLPWGIRYLNGSGSIVSGARAGTVLTPQLAGTVIAWPVVSDTAALIANDSLVVFWRGVVDTSKTNLIVNTVYADLMGYPPDSIGAQARSVFGDSIPPDTIIIPPDTIIIPPDTGTVQVSANPAGSIFSRSVIVTLTASRPGAAIWYTFNGLEPDSGSLSSRRYTGPIAFDTTTTLKAIAYAPRCLPSEVITQTYERLRTVPVKGALFFDNNGDGLADGIKVLLQTVPVAPNMPVIRKFTDLITVTGAPPVDSLVFAGDTMTIRFSGAGSMPAPNALLTVTEPILPSATYTNAHGYLAGGSSPVTDGVAPVIASAVYRPNALLNSTRGQGDTLIVAFNEYAQLTDSISPLIPFIVSGAGGSYTFSLQYLGRVENNGMVFLVLEIGGENPVPLPNNGDLIRILPGRIVDGAGTIQTNPSNKQAALQLVQPEYRISIKIGPNPFNAGTRVAMVIETVPAVQSALRTLRPTVCLFDYLGNQVLKETNASLDARRGNFRFEWDGRSSDGRIVGSGSYLAVIVTRSASGQKVVNKQMVGFYR